MNNDSGHNGKKPISIEAKLLFAYLVGVLDSADPNRLVTYEELGMEVGMADVREDRGPLYTARRSMERERHVFFRTVHGKGLRRARKADFTATMIEQVEHGRRGDRRAFRRGQMIPHLEYGELSPVERIQHDLHATLLAARTILSGKRARRLIEGRVAETQKQIAFAPLVELLKKGEAAAESVKQEK